MGTYAARLPLALRGTEELAVVPSHNGRQVILTPHSAIGLGQIAIAETRPLDLATDGDAGVDEARVAHVFSYAGSMVEMLDAVLASEVDANLRMRVQGLLDAVVAVPA